MGSGGRRKHATRRSLLATFIGEAARLRFYQDVIWAGKHYHNHYPTNLGVELAIAVASVALGEIDHAIRTMRHVLVLHQNHQRIVTLIGRLVRTDLTADSINAVAAVQAISEAVRPPRHRIAGIKGVRQDSSVRTAHRHTPVASKKL